MAKFEQALPSRLSIFVTDPETGRPVQRLPIYAEVAVPGVVPAPPVDERFREPIRAALLEIDPTASEPGVRERVENAALQAIAEQVEEASRNALRSQPERARELFQRVFEEALRASGRASLGALPPAELKQLLAAALRQGARQLGLGLTAEVEDHGVVWADPLGVLTTDHVGYASFDLRRLRPDVQILLAEAIEERRRDPNAEVKLAIWLHPYGRQERYDALAQARFALDAIVARLFMSWHTLPASLINMGPRALQEPSLTDWRLSPASFAASPKTLVGEDGCEELIPSNLALQEFVLRQVVRLTEVPEGFGLPRGLKAAYVDDYKVSWYSLGHSLGEILYSLPLAPGETVKLAVIDWSWDSLTQRDETTRLTENLLHQTHRDRTISETVKAGLQELQRGSSFMGGTASAAGASGGANAGVAGLGAAVGNTWSLGGSTATSQGSRQLAAENVQRLNDSFSQASSAQREINSTVVIQARQEEKESIQTRTFSNYNHSHTLTILYYQVLRHYRVTVEWVRRRPAVLLQIPPRVASFDAATLIGHRALLEANLLDPSLKTAFDLLEKQEAIREHQALHGIAPSDNPVAQGWDGNLAFSLFEFGIRTGEGDDETDELVMINLILVDGTTVSRPLVRAWNKASVSDDMNVGDRFNYKNDWAWFIAKPDAPIPWHQLMGFEFVLHDNDEWRMTGLAINAFHAGGRISLYDLEEVSYWFPLNGSSQTVTRIKRPAPQPPMLPPPHRAPEKQLSVEEYHLVRKLTDHFARHKDYYNRILLLGTDPTSISIQMETEGWDGGSMADHVDPTPLEVFGSFVAYPLAKRAATVDDTVVVDIAAALNGNDPARRQWALDTLAAMGAGDRQSVLDRLPLASAKSERLNTMPTRGVFAEGKLGHCNVSEEIDNTRFWKWEEHPIPIQAPDINPVTPVQPQPQQVAAAPTPFPQSLVNIVNPSAAPDPTGLAAALSLLGTPNIFRDMSGRQEVADLLKKLSDNSIAIAEAATRARDIQAKYGASGGVGAGPGAGGGSGEPAKGLGAPRNQPSDRSSTTHQDLQDLQHVLGNAQKKNLITPEAARETYTNAVQGAFDPEFVRVGGGGTTAAPAVRVTAATDDQLKQAAAVEFFNAVDVENYFRDVTGKTFAGWFTSTLAGRGSWAPLSMSVDADTLQRFTATWDAFPPILGTDRGAGARSVTLPEFATLMAKFLHETGGRLQFRGAEMVGGYGHPGLSYAFDTFVIQRPNEAAYTKGSYNGTNGNHTAYASFHDPIYLAAFGTLAPTAQAVRDRNEWKGSAWPAGVPMGLDASTAFLQEADFYKFRGRGAIQSTGRAAYLPIVEFVRGYGGGDAGILAVQQRWATLATTLAATGINLTTNDDFATVSTNADWDALFASVTIQAVAIRGHNEIPGKQYLPMSNSAAVLRGTGRGSPYFLAIAIAGNNPSYGNDVRQRMLDFIGTLWATPMPPLAPTPGTIDL